MNFTKIKLNKSFLFLFVSLIFSFFIVTGCSGSHVVAKNPKQDLTMDCNGAKKLYFGPIRIERNNNHVILKFTSRTSTGRPAPLTGEMGDEVYVSVVGGTSGSTFLPDATSGMVTVPVTLDEGASKHEVTIELYNWAYYKAGLSDWNDHDLEYWNKCTIPLDNLPSSSVYNGCPAEKHICFEITPYEVTTNRALEATPLCIYTIDPTEPGDFYTGRSIEFRRDAFLESGWCAVDEDTLDSNLSQMNYKWTIDGIEVDPYQMGKIRGKSQDGKLICESYIGIVKGLVPGTHEIIQTRQMKHDINDGLNKYKKGNYVFQCDVSVQ